MQIKPILMLLNSEDIQFEMFKASIATKTQ